MNAHFYTAKELAEYLHVSLKHIYRLLDAGEIEYNSFGERNYRIPWKAVDDYVEKTAVKPKWEHHQHGHFAGIQREPEIVAE